MIKKYSSMVIFSAFISLSLFLMMQATIELPQHAETKDMFSDNTLMGRSYLTTTKEEVTHKPDYIFNPNIVMRHTYGKILCHFPLLLKQTIYKNPNKKFIISRSDIYL